MKFELEREFEEVVVFLSLFLVLTSLIWLLFGNYQIKTNPIVLVVVGLVFSGVTTWFLYTDKDEKKEPHTTSS